MAEFNPFQQLLQSRIAGDTMREQRSRNAFEEQLQTKQLNQADALKRIQVLAPVAARLSSMDPQQRAAVYPGIAQEISRIFPDLPMPQQYGPEVDRGLVVLTAFHNEMQTKPTPLMQNLEAAGYSPGSPEYQKAARESIKPSTGTPYFSPVQTAEGIYSFDARTGKIVPSEYGGRQIVGSTSDPALQGELGEAKETGKGIGETNMAQYEAASNAVGQIRQIDELVNHIKTSEAITGLGAELFKNIERAKSLIGDDVATGKASDTEILDAMMGSEVFPMIKSLGIGARGLDTPAEREFMRSVLTGSIQLNKATLLRMAEIRRNVAKRAINKWNDRLKRGELGRFYGATGLEPSPFVMPGREEGKTDKPPMEGARKAPDGNWYVERNGQFFKVE